jgi:hypothetical protein
MNIALLSSLTILAALLSGCGGGQGASTSPLAAADPGRTAYALDDYVVGGTANVYRLGTGTLLYSTTTGEKGAFSWPASLTGDVRVEVVGGYEDIDGLNATSTDRTAFIGTLSAVFNADQSTGPVLLSAISTGLTLAAGASLSQYNSLKEALPNDVQAVFFLNASDSPASIPQKLATALAIQRAAGFSSLVSELADDGRLNGSTGTSAASVSLSVASATSTTPISVMTDLALQYCVASAIGKEPSLVTLDDLTTVTQLYCNDSGVVSIKGIGALANLESLFLDKNDIADATPIKTLAKLSYITLADNRLASIDALKTGAYAGLAMDVEGNCITDSSNLVDSPALKVIWFTKVPARQYPGCNKNDADIRRITAKLSPIGAFVLTYNTTTNPVADCRVQWSDGASQAALCDGKSHTVQHAFADSSAELSASIVINGSVKASKSLSGPAAALAADFGLDRLNASWTFADADDPTQAVTLAYRVAQVGVGKALVAYTSGFAWDENARALLAEVSINATQGIAFSRITGIPATAGWVLPYLPGYDFGAFETLFFPTDASLGRTWSSANVTHTNCEFLDGSVTQCVQFVNIKSTIVVATEKFSELCPLSPLANLVSLKPIKVQQVYTFSAQDPTTYKPLGGITREFWVAPGLGFVASRRLLSGRRAGAVKSGGGTHRHMPCSTPSRSASPMCTTHCRSRRCRAPDAAGRTTRTRAAWHRHGLDGLAGESGHDGQGRSHQPGSADIECDGTGFLCAAGLPRIASPAGLLPAPRGERSHGEGFVAGPALSGPATRARRHGPAPGAGRRLRGRRVGTDASH